MTWGLCFGFFYEEGTDSFFKLLSNGFYTGNHDYYFNLGILRYHSICYSFLYSKWPNTEWYDVFTFFHLVLLTVAIILALKLIWKRYVWLLLLVIISLFLEQFFLVQLTRLAFLITGLAVLVLTSDCDDRKQSSSLLLFFLVLYGGLIRIDSSVLAMVIVAPAIVVFLLRFQSQKKLTPVVVALVLITLLSYSYTVPLTDVDQKYDTIRPYTYTLWDYRGPAVDHTNLSPLQLGIISVFERKFFDDSQVINEAFFVDAGIDGMDKRFDGIRNQFENGIRYLPEFFRFGYKDLFKYSWSIALFLGFIATTTLRLVPNKRIYFLLLSLWPLSVIMILAVFFKLESRIVSPIVLLSIIQGTLLFKDHMVVGTRVIDIIGVLPIIPILYGAVMVKNDVQVRSELFQVELSDIYASTESPLFVTMNVLEQAHSALTFQAHAPMPSLYSIHNAHVSMYPSYRKKMFDLTNGKDFKSYLGYLSNCDHCLVLSSRYRIETLQMFVDLCYTDSQYFFQEICSGKSEEIDALNDLGYGLFSIRIKTYE